MEENRKFIWNAKDYAKHSSAQQEWARELIAKLKLKGHEQVLDIGCGDGKITAEIAGYVPGGGVIGIDSSEEMIRLARESFVNDRNHNLSFLVCDAGDLTFRDQFDVVFSNATLHWIRDHRPVISGIQRSLKPGGRILLQMGGKGNAAAILLVVEELMEEDEWREFFTGFQFSYGFYGPEEYTKWISKTGLLPVRIELIPKVMSYDHRDGLAGWVRTTWLPYIERVPDEKKEKFITTVVDRYIMRNRPDGEGNIRVQMMRLEVEAAKNK